MENTARITNEDCYLVLRDGDVLNGIRCILSGDGTPMFFSDKYDGHYWKEDGTCYTKNAHYRVWSFDVMALFSHEILQIALSLQSIIKEN